MSLLGIDIGTTGCKATILDAGGTLLAQAYQEYFLISEHPGWQELDPEQVWQAVCRVIRQVAGTYRGEPVRAIGVSSFGEAVIPINREGLPLCNSMIYIDVRGGDEAAYLREQIGDKRALSITGTYIQPMYSLCKILWLKRNRREIFERTWKFLLFADYILFRLGAAAATDYTLAARTMAFDIVQKRWSEEMLDAAGLSPDQFGTPVQSGSAVGKIKQTMAEELGLPLNVLLVAGGHDQACAALGAGVIRPGLAVDGLGTTECITPAFPHPILTDKMADNHFASVPHVLPDLYVTYAFTFTSGSVLKWYRDNFAADFRMEAQRLGVDVYELMINRATATPAPVLVLPHFAGAATPYMDAGAKGAILGLSIETRPGDIIKGILEGITFEIMLNLERLETAGVVVDELLAVGGLARSASFLQLKADMMGKRITVLDIPEAGTVGVAMLAGMASGVYGNVTEAVAGQVRRSRSFFPDPYLHARYRERFEMYKNLYEALKRFR